MSFMEPVPTGTEQPSDYHRKRFEQERREADRATHPLARQLHLQLAEMHRLLSDSRDGSAPDP